MSKENYKNYFNGGCSTCMFAERDERGRYIGSCSGFSNCSYKEYKGKTDITEEEKDQKIADLEAKLAESEKEANARYESWQEEIRECDRLRVVLSEVRKQLAESESKVKVGEFWHSAYQGKQLDYDKVYAELRQSYDENEKLKQQLAESNESHHKNIVELTKIATEKDRRIDELKQKLDEKQKEIEINKNALKKLIKNCGTVKCENKISFAIAELKKAKGKIIKVPITDYDLSGNFEKMYKQDAIRQIDNQIKQLKEGK